MSDSYFYPTTGYYSINGASGVNNQYVGSDLIFQPDSSIYSLLESSPVYYNYQPPSPYSGIYIGQVVDSGNVLTNYNTIGPSNYSDVSIQLEMQPLLNGLPVYSYVTVKAHANQYNSIQYISRSLDTNINTYSAALPAGHASGDILLLSVATNAPTLSTPAGWTLINDAPQSTSNPSTIYLYTYWKRDSGSESNPSITITATYDSCYCSTAVRGCDTGPNPIDNSIVFASLLSNSGVVGEYSYTYPFTSYYAESYIVVNGVFSRHNTSAGPFSYISSSGLSDTVNDDYKNNSTYTSPDHFTLNHISGKKDIAGLTNIIYTRISSSSQTVDVASSIVALKKSTNATLVGQIYGAKILSKTPSGNKLLSTYNSDWQKRTVLSYLPTSYSFLNQYYDYANSIEAWTSGYPLILSLDLYTSGNPLTSESKSGVSFVINSIKMETHSAIDSWPPEYFSGVYDPYNNGYAFPLYLYSSLPSSGDTPLAITGDIPISSSTDMFIAAKANFSGNVPLTVYNGPMFTYFPLYINPGDYESSGNLNLYTLGPESYSPLPQTNAFNLYIHNFATDSSGLPLYITAPLSGVYDSNFPLYLQTIDPPAETSGVAVSLYNSMNMFINGPLPSTNELGLFLSADVSGLADFPLYLYSDTGGPSSNFHTLYIKGLFETTSGNFPLYIAPPSSSNSGVSLYIEGTPNTSYGSTTLFTRNNYYDIISSSTELFLANKLESSGNLTLHTMAGLSQATTPLYISVIEDNTQASGLDMFIYSSSSSGLFNTSPLYLASDRFGQSTTLYIANDVSPETSDDITLYINNSNEFSSAVNLYLESIRSSGNTVNLYTEGAGSLIGASVARGYTTLYMARDYDSIDGVVPMYLHAPIGSNSGVDLYISGGTYVTNSVNLSLANIQGLASGNTPLYVHGF